jgi:medium-chain acyl-[acyl-carrier-protein] hydrolase
MMNGEPNKTDNATTGAHVVPGVILFCIPHAGGGASAYRQWAAAMAPGVAVKVLQLRGRESRFREPPLTELEDAVADLYQNVLPASTGRFAFLGHSMGALMALELSHKLRRETGRAPVHLFVSACRAPTHPQLAAPCAGLPQAEFVAEVMRRYGGIPAPILADADFMAAILPAMRADFGILERYRAAERPPLDCPISVFGGRDDHATPEATLANWRLQTTGAFTLEMLDGGHFYLQDKRREVAAKIRAALAAAP